MTTDVRRGAGPARTPIGSLGAKAGSYGARASRGTAGGRRAIALSAALGSSLSPAGAEPYLGLRAGKACAACHVNVTGGGMRNDRGVAYGLETMPRKGVADREDPTVFRGRIADLLSIGSDLRVAHTSTFARSDDANEFDVREASLYADLQLVRGRLHLYLDERVAPGAAAGRETFALLDRLPGRLYVKAGRFYPAFGWRLQDDTAFIRSVTGFNFAAPDDGVEVGHAAGVSATSLSVTNGSGGAVEQDDDKQIALLSAVTFDSVRAGVSAAANRRDDEGRALAGAHAGVRWGPLVLLGEADAARVESRTGTPPPGSIRTTVRQIITYVEADFLVHAGVNVKATHDYFDPDRSQSGDEVDRVGAGVEYTPSPSMQLRLLWRRTDRPPRVRGIPFEDDREVLAELHLYL